MKYKLINTKTKEETICDKVTIDGFDYYVSDAYGKPAIATNNPNIDDVPKVVDEVTEMAYNWLYDEETENKASQGYPLKPMEYGFIKGYTKSQETHPFSEEDMIEFLNWIRDNTVFDSAPKPYHRKTQTRLSQEELLQLWKEQKPKTLYYE